MNRLIVRTDDGVALALHHFTPGARRGPPLLLMHGVFSSHTVWLRGGSRRSGMATFLAGRGHDLWLGEWRSHGAADREPAPGTWQFEDIIIRDAPALVAAVRHETGLAPVWVGHSLAGAQGLAFLARQPAALAGIVALGTPGPVMGLVRRALALGTIAICRAAGRFPARALRMGSEDEAALVLAEWMRWNTRGRWVGADGFDYLAALANAPAPFLAVAGDADHLFAPAAACRVLVEHSGAADKSLVVVGPRLNHPGLLLSPRADAECWPLVADWIARRSLPVPVPAGIAT